MAWNVTVTSEELHVVAEAGIVYREAGKLKEAREVFAGLQAMRPQHDLPEILLGTVRFREQDFAQAIGHYQKALELNPHSALAYANQAEAEMFRHEFEAARESCRKAIELDADGEAGAHARGLLPVIDDLAEQKG